MFTPETFSAGQGSSDYRSDLATYKTDDLIDTVMATGYFPVIPGRQVNPGSDNAPVGEFARNGDYIYVDAGDATGIFYCVWDIVDPENGLGLVSIGLDNIPAP